MQLAINFVPKDVHRHVRF